MTGKNSVLGNNMESTKTLNMKEFLMNIKKKENVLFFTTPVHIINNLNCSLKIMKLKEIVKNIIRTEK